MHGSLVQVDEPEEPAGEQDLDRIQRPAAESSAAPGIGSRPDLVAPRVDLDGRSGWGPTAPTTGAVGRDHVVLRSATGSTGHAGACHAADGLARVERAADLRWLPDLACRDDVTSTSRRGWSPRALSKCCQLSFGVVPVDLHRFIRKVLLPPSTEILEQLIALSVRDPTFIDKRQISKVNL